MSGVVKGFAKAGAAVATTGASAAKRISGIGSSFKAAATVGAKKGAGNAAALAKKSDAAADAGKASAKGADDVVGASAQTSKATKQLDTAADVSKGAKKGDDVADASKGVKKADDVADAAKAGKKTSKAKQAAKYTAAGGLAYYISEQIGAANEKVGDCIENCLPDNWASYQYEEIGKDELNYKNLEELKEADPEYDEPICTEKIDDGKQGPCPTFCSKTCNDKYDKGVLDALGPAGDVIEDVTGGAGDLMEQTLTDLGLNPFGPGGLFEGMKETITKIIFVILCICCLSIILKLTGVF